MVEIRRQFFSLFVFATALLSVKATLSKVTLTEVSKSWKQFFVSWNLVNQASEYDTLLKCNHSETSQIVNTLSVVYNTVPTNANCSFEIFASNKTTGEKSEITAQIFQSADYLKAPQNLTLIKDTNFPETKVHVHWMYPNITDVNRLKTIRYYIYYTDSEIRVINGKNFTTGYMSTNYTVEGLEENTIYWVKVAAYDENTMETANYAKNQILTSRAGLANYIIAIIVIAVSVFIIIILTIATKIHFKKKYGRI